MFEDSLFQQPNYYPAIMFLQWGTPDWDPTVSPAPVQTEAVASWPGEACLEAPFKLRERVFGIEGNASNISIYLLVNRVNGLHICVPPFLI